MIFSPKHKLMALVLGTCLMASVPASAHVDVNVDLGLGGGGYAEPTYAAPVYAAPTYVGGPVGYPGYYHDRHYWHGRRDYHHHR